MKGRRSRSEFMMGVSRDSGQTWTQEIVNVRELDPAHSKIKPGDMFWFRQMKFVVQEIDGKIQAVHIVGR